MDGTSPGLRAHRGNAAHKRGTTLGTHTARAPKWPAARCCGTHTRIDAQQGQWAAGPRKEVSVLPVGRGCSKTAKCGHTAPGGSRSRYGLTDSETKTVTSRVTIEPGFRDTMIMHMSHESGVLQGLGPAWPSPLRMARTIRLEKNA